MAIFNVGICSMTLLKLCQKLTPAVGPSVYFIMSYVLIISLYGDKIGRRILVIDSGSA